MIPVQSEYSKQISQRVLTLQNYFEYVWQYRMLDVPILNKSLRVEMVGFGYPSIEGSIIQGIILTPWLMSLCRLPLIKQVSYKRSSGPMIRDFGAEQFEFIGTHDSIVGDYETCALFSPMFEFTTQESARNVAMSVLDNLYGSQSVVAPTNSNNISRREFITRIRAKQA